MASPPRKEEIGKHFQNGQRRYRDNEAEFNARYGCVGTGGLSPTIAKVNSSNIPTESNTTQPTATGQLFRPSASEVSAYSGASRSGSMDASYQNLPEPTGLNREFLIYIQSVPAHLREQVMFNIGCSRMVDLPTSEAGQYTIERKKIIARMILTKKAEELGMDEKFVEMILDCIERLLY